KEATSQHYIVMPIWKDASYFDTPLKDVEDGTHNEDDDKDKSEDYSSLKIIAVLRKLMLLDNIYRDAQEVDLGNIPYFYGVPTTSHARIHKDHPIKNVIGEVNSSIQTRRMTKPTTKKGFLSAVYEKKTHVTLNTCLYACFLSQIEPTSIAKALSNSSWVEAIQKELLQFKLQQVCLLVDLPYGKKAIRTKWVFKNKKDEKGIVIRNKARGKIDPTLFIKKQRGDILLVQIYADDIIFGFTYKELCTAFEKLMKDKFQMSSMGELIFFLGLQVTQKEDGIFISHDKYIHEILKKFNFSDVKSASTPVDLEKPLVKDKDANDADVHLYRSMIGSLIYLIASRPYIMFAVCACARFQVTPKTSHLLAVKRILRYLKGKLILGLWYPRDSLFELVAYTDSDYAGATQDRNSTIRDLLTKGFNVGDEAVHKKLGDRMKRATTTASSLEAEQDSGDVEAQTRFEAASKQFNDPLLLKVNTLECGRIALD
nr:hypothetical protein [Tanacetum cinerariifolium]